ncbi:MAG: hypothetical protein GTO29_04845 [Candidatus Latescibacteria bacterium]|nr:hypothetical protein [Candidatus Latescibacterota bacterium]NIO55413.1 hypothetical protein [Candidatus Latescibacterota bacterium]
MTVIKKRYIGKLTKPETLIAPIVYLLLSSYLLQYYRYRINPDATSYITIAQKYLSGDFYDAVVGHWGPLFSWLLVPLLAIGIPKIIATKVLLMLIGALTIIGVQLLSYRFDISASIRRAIMASVVPIVLFCSLITITPDLLIACILIYYFYIIFSSDYPESESSGIYCGVLGGLAYLAKHYGLPFFLSHFLIMNIVSYLAKKTRAAKALTLRALVLGVTAFLVISCPWIITMSKKYGEMTTGTSAKFVYARYGPDSSGLSWRDTLGLREPPTENAVSAWEDPHFLYLDMEAWSPLESWDNVKQELKNVVNNVTHTRAIFEKFSPFMLVVIVVYFLLCVGAFKRIEKRDLLIKHFVTLVVYTIGYCLIIVTYRFLYATWFLLLLMTGQLLTLVFRYSRLNLWRRGLVLTLVLLSFFAWPFKRLVISANQGKYEYEVAQMLEARYGVGGNIASNSRWHQTLYVVFHLTGRYYGTVRDRTSSGNLITELSENNIDYYLAWDEMESERSSLNHYNEVTGDEIPGLRVYSLKGKE